VDYQVHCSLYSGRQWITKYNALFIPAASGLPSTLLSLFRPPVDYQVHCSLYSGRQWILPDLYKWLAMMSTYLVDSPGNCTTDTEMCHCHNNTVGVQYGTSWRSGGRYKINILNKKGISGLKKNLNY
jgi:hypothetical protein